MQSPHYIKNLDGLRAIAVLLVIVWHYVLGLTTADMLPDGVWLGLSWAWSGVDLFFVLSGFLIGRILMYYKGSQNYFKTFYIRRALRIFPPYYLLLLTYVVLVGIGFTKHLPVLLLNAIPQYSYFIYIQNFYVDSRGFGANWLAPTWSLAVEEQFYLIFPLLIHFTKHKHLPGLFIGGIILAPIIRGLIGGHAAYVLLPARMDALLMGALIAWLFHHEGIKNLFENNRKFLGWITLGVFALMLVLVFKGPGRETGGILNHSVYAVLYGLVIITILVSRSKIISGCFGNAVITYLGKISYSIYLWHQVFNLALNKFILGQDVPWMSVKYTPPVMLLAFVCTIAFASLSYHLLEKPLQKIGKNYAY